MGVGLGQAIAAAMAYPNKRIFHICGDSAFGFSGMELETIARYKLPITVIIMNNNGIYSGLDEETFNQVAKESAAETGIPNPPSTALMPSARYERMAECFGGLGFHVKSQADLSKALASSTGLTVINVEISPFATRKPQVAIH